MILHITNRSSWTEAEKVGEYRGDTLTAEGFIHCSTPQQVIGVANIRFRGRRNLVLLCIDRNAVKPKIVDENLEGGETLFPHIYGPLNLDAVIDVLGFPPGEDGCFQMPGGLGGPKG